MKGIEVKSFLRKIDVPLSEIARRLGTSSQNLSNSLSKDDIRTGLLEDIAAAVGKDVPFFYGVDTSDCQASATGDGSTAIAGSGNNVNSENFVKLLTKKDEQIDRLLSIIEHIQSV